MKLINNLSLEDSNESVKSIETEVVIYSKINNPEGLNECIGKEEHIQLEAKFTKEGGRARVRKTIEIEDGEEDIDYEFTVKLDQENESLDSSIEQEVEVDEDFFNAFKVVAERALKKTRYKFLSNNITLKLSNDEEEHEVTIPNVEYEVDVFYRADGSVSEWCKIDVEVDNIINFLHKHYKNLESWKLKVKVSHLPFEPSENILSTDSSEEQQQLIDDLWTSWTISPLEV